jgi:hypothetical protein
MPKTNHQRGYRENNQSSITKTKRWKRVWYHDVSNGHRGISYSIKGRKRAANQATRREGKTEIRRTLQEV